MAFEMFMTDSNQHVGAGANLSYHKDGTRYEGSLDLQNPVRLQQELVHGREFSCGRTKGIEFTTVDRQDKFTFQLLQNGYEQRVSFAGHATYRDLVYNLSAFVIPS